MDWAFKESSPRFVFEGLKQVVEQFALRSINLLIRFVNREELPEEWKESIIAPIYKKDDKTDCSNYRGI
jgi:hypothetical protein